jgi:aspartate 1-decarboxylase
LVGITSTSASAIVVPANATVAFPIGTTITLIQLGTGQVTVNGAAGVTVRVASWMILALYKQYSVATLLKVALDTWVLSGDLGTV